MHAPDCALVIYSLVDPSTLKQPLSCDCEESEPAGDTVTNDDDVEVSPTRPAPSGPTETLTGAAARTFKQLRTAETALKAAQKRKDDALAAFLAAVTG